MFFPSISTLKTSLPPIEYLSALYSFRALNQNLLISAFDLSRSSGKCELELINKLQLAQDKGVIILMDSGNYESFWKEKKDSWQQSNFHSALSRYPYTFSFGFDEQCPPRGTTAHIKLVVDRWRSDQEVGGNRTIVPIVHGNRLLDTCSQVAHETEVPMVAVAERSLGEGIFKRVKTVMSLREALNRTGRYVGLHLLGTGNPISIALYSWAGADSFDGLEWCQTVVDHHTGLLSHFSHADFFWGPTSGDQISLSFKARTLAQNLRFYVNWMQRLRADIHDGNGVIFCQLNFPQHIYNQCADAFQWEK